MLKSEVEKKDVNGVKDNDNIVEISVKEQFFLGFEEFCFKIELYEQ